MINEQTSIYLTTQMSKLQSGFPISCQKSLLHVLRAKHILFFRMTKRNEYVVQQAHGIILYQQTIRYYTVSTPSLLSIPLVQTVIS